MRFVIPVELTYTVIIFMILFVLLYVRYTNLLAREIARTNPVIYDHIKKRYYEGVEEIRTRIKEQEELAKQNPDTPPDFKGEFDEYKRRKEEEK